MNTFPAFLRRRDIAVQSPIDLNENKPEERTSDRMLSAFEHQEARSLHVIEITENEVNDLYAEIARKKQKIADEHVVLKAVSAAREVLASELPEAKIHAEAEASLMRELEITP